MAITGSEFVCKNKECKNVNTGITLTSPWPLGEIDRVINSKRVSKNEPFKAQLEEMKKKGREFVCIALPDSEKIPVVGYRIHMWCDKCPCIWTYDAMIPENHGEEIISDAIKNANIPENCPTCNSKLKTFSEVIDNKGDGINCPLCHDNLQKKVWFSNEIEDEKDEKTFMKQK